VINRKVFKECIKQDGSPLGHFLARQTVERCQIQSSLIIVHVPDNASCGSMAEGPQGTQPAVAIDNLEFAFFRRVRANREWFIPAGVLNVSLQLSGRSRIHVVAVLRVWHE